MARHETVISRVDRLIAAAVARGDYRSPAEVLDTAGLSTGYLAELRGRCAADPLATMTARTAEKLAGALRVGVGELLGDLAPAPDDDACEARSWAVVAARALKYSESAIGRVRAEPPDHQASALYWFRRIETEHERGSPSAGVGRQPRKRPRRTKG